MDKIFYGICGEGLGHTTRSLSIIEKLNCHVHIFTWGESFDYLNKIKYPFLHKISGLPWGRNKHNEISLIPSFCNFLEFICNSSSFDYILKKAKELKPSLIISDYEPFVIKVANQLSIKSISIDNQHRFNCKMKLPYGLSVYKNIIGAFNNFIIPKVDYTIVTSFHCDFIENENFILTNFCLRNCFENLDIKNENFILVYYKKSCGEKILQLLSKTNEKVKVYNAPTNIQLKYNTMEHYPISDKFIEDLAKCKCVISAAGHQLISEAIFCKKPILAIPENNQPEQMINGYFLEKMECGMCRSVDKLDLETINTFLNTNYQQIELNNGVEEIVKTIWKLKEK